MHPERLAGTLAAAIRNSHELHAEVADSYRIALAWMYRGKAGIFWHDGAVAGYTSDVFFCPEGDYAAVVLLNSSPALIGSPDLICGAHPPEAGGRAGGLARDGGGSGERGFSGFLRWFAAYWMTMIAAFDVPLLLRARDAGDRGAVAAARLFLRASALLQWRRSACSWPCTSCSRRFRRWIRSITEEGAQPAGDVSVLLVSRHVSPTERVDAPAVRAPGAAGVDRARDCGRKHGDGVLPGVRADAAADRGIAGHRAGGARRGTGGRASAVRSATAHRPVQQAHAAAQPAASRDSRVLSRDRLRDDGVVHQIAGGARPTGGDLGARSVAPGERADAGGERHA